MNANATLYEIRDDLDALAALLYEVGGDITEDEAAAAIDAWLRETDEALRDKLDRYAAMIREKESKAVSRRTEADRLTALARADSALVERLKARLQWFFEDQGIEKMETARFKFAMAGNGGQAPVELLAPEWLVPEWAKRTVVTIDKESIRQAIDRGEEVDFARIGERGKHLRIR